MSTTHKCERHERRKAVAVVATSHGTQFFACRDCTSKAPKRAERIVEVSK